MIFKFLGLEVELLPLHINKVWWYQIQILIITVCFIIIKYWIIDK